MTSSYTDNIGIEKPETGDQVGTWGITDNLNYDIVDQAISGYVSVTLASAGTSGSPNNFAITDGALSNGRNPFISFTDGGDLGGDVFVRLTSNAHKKMGWIENNLSGSQDLYVFQGNYNASNDYVIPAGQRALLRFDGGGTGAVVTNVLTDARIENAVFAGNLTVGGTLGVTGATTLTGGLAGNPAINTGNLVMSTAGKGVDFSANTESSQTGVTMTSELLDWYEEGTWTPVLWDNSLSSGESQAYVSQVGSYTRIGNSVRVSGYITLSDLGSLTTTHTAKIGGLPFRAATFAGHRFSISVGYASGLDKAAGQSVSGYIPASEGGPGGNVFYAILEAWDDATGTTALTIDELTANGSIAFSATYPTS